MGMGTLLLLIFFIITVVLWMAGERSLVSEIFEANPETGEMTISFASLTKTLAISAGIAFPGIVVGLYGIVTGNPWAIFVGVAAWLMTWAILPIGLLTDPLMPVEIKFILGGGLSLLWALSILSWFRGVEL